MTTISDEQKFNSKCEIEKRGRKNGRREQKKKEKKINFKTYLGSKSSLVSITSVAIFWIVVVVLLFNKRTAFENCFSWILTVEEMEFQRIFLFVGFSIVDAANNLKSQIFINKISFNEWCNSRDFSCICSLSMDFGRVFSRLRS